MEIDELTKKKITNYLNQIMDSNTTGTNAYVAAGMYGGAIKVLKLLDIEIDEYTVFKK